MCVLEQVGMAGRCGSVVLHIQERGFMFKISAAAAAAAKSLQSCPTSVRPHKR